jgi:hypothetical protein
VSRLSRLAQRGGSSPCEVRFHLICAGWQGADHSANTRLVREKETENAPPGLFQVLATGPADVSVHLENEFVARLGDRLLMWQNLKVLDFSKSFRHLSKKSS